MTPLGHLKEMQAATDEIGTIAKARGQTLHMVSVRLVQIALMEETSVETATAIRDLLEEMQEAERQLAEGVEG